MVRLLLAGFGTARFGGAWQGVAWLWRYDVTTFVPTEIERKTTQAGKPYVRAKIPGQGWVSIWGSDDANLILYNPTATFTGEIIQNGNFKNLEQVALASPEQA